MFMGMNFFLKLFFMHTFWCNFHRCIRHFLAHVFFGMDYAYLAHVFCGTMFAYRNYFVCIIHAIFIGMDYAYPVTF